MPYYRVGVYIYLGTVATKAHRPCTQVKRVAVADVVRGQRLRVPQHLAAENDTLPRLLDLRFFLEVWQVLVWMRVWRGRLSIQGSNSLRVIITKVGELRTFTNSRNFSTGSSRGTRKLNT